MATGGTNLFAQTLADNRIYLFRLQILIVDGGLLVLRNIFDQTLYASSLTLATCLNNEMKKITSLKKRGIITQSQYDILYPTGGTVPSTLDMDITLIISLLRNLKCFRLNAKFNWSATPVGTDLSVEADISRLKKYRNYICHISTTTEIQHKMFISWLKDIEQILIRLDSSVQKSVQNIQQVIDGYKKSPIDTQIEKRIEKEIKKWNDIETNVDSLKEGMGEIKEEVDVIRDDLKRLQDESTRDKKKGNILQRCLRKRRYKRARQKLKDDLIISYRLRHSTVQLSPLFEEKDTPLATFYVRPEIIEKNPGTDKMVRFKSLTDMFRSKNEVNRELYLTANAGLGKTTFSKYLATSWCAAHCPENRTCRTIFEKNDIDSMKTFEFVFLVLLRDSNNLCSIDDLIFELIISTLAHSEKFDKSFLQEILNRESCLVILDGLDEWTHPDNNGKYCYRTPRSIPHRNDRQRCTILTTTRPWKIGVLNLSSNELGKQLQLTKLSYDSAVTLTERTLQRLKSLHNEDSLKEEVGKFNEEINTGDNDGLASVPLLLMYTICLWCDAVEIGNSKCELYVNIVELLLSRTAAKHGELQSLSQPLDRILECFTGHDHCTKYFPFLVAVGELAYHTLFNEKKENTLVFEGSLAQNFLKDDMKLSLLSGILTESTTKTLTKRISKVSFPHKTVQEFFAAIFINYQTDAQEIILEKCGTVQSILDISTVCQFISRLNASMICEISVSFMTVIDEDEKTCAYKTRTHYEDIDSNSLYHIQNMLMSCIKEMPDNENIKMCLHDYFINCHSEKHLKCFSKLIDIKSLYIDTRGISSSIEEIIDLCYLSGLSSLQKIYYEGDGSQKEADINRFLSPSLQTLSLWSGKWLKHGENLNTKLEQIQNLNYLHINCFTFSHEILKTFLNFISSKKTLKAVNLSMLICNEHGDNCGRMKLDFSNHSQLREVNLLGLPSLQLNITTPSLVKAELSLINLGESSLLLSPEMLSIKFVGLSVEMSAESLQNNMKILESIPHSVTVEMDQCSIEPEIEREHFRNYIRKSENFQVIRDDYNNAEE